MVIQRERTEERGYDETERGPDTPWVFERSKWFKKTQKKFKGHHNLGYIPVSTMALLMDPAKLHFQGQLSNLQNETGWGGWGWR